MKNVTLSIDEQTLEAGRAYAQAHHTSLNALIRDLLAQAVTRDPESSVQELVRLAESHAGDSKGVKWKRDELHER